MDDESGESMEPMEEVPLISAITSEALRPVRSCARLLRLYVRINAVN